MVEKSDTLEDCTFTATLLQIDWLPLSKATVALSLAERCSALFSDPVLGTADTQEFQNFEPAILSAVSSLVPFTDDTILMHVRKHAQP